MGSALALAGMRRTLLGTALTLAIGGVAGLAVSSNEALAPQPRHVSPTYGTVGPLDALPGTTATSAAERARRTHNTWLSGGYLETPRGLPRGTTTTTPEDPDAQVEAAVPAAGAHASVGQGSGSCTDVAITALTPDDCPPPEGDDPVIVDPGPTPDPSGAPKDGYLAA
jgi:hypothetical protein